MRSFSLVLLVLFASLAFGEKSGPSGFNPPAQVRGTYTVEETFAVGLASAYGLAIQREIPNSIWISQYAPLVNNEFDMTTGTATGSTWPISSGVDADDMGYCEYASSPNQFFFGDWGGSSIAVYDVSTTSANPYFMKDLAGPAGWQAVCGVGAGHGNIYASDFFADEIAWAEYTGTETTVTWSSATFASVSGMSVYMDWLFVVCQITGSDNIFIFELNPDGSPIMTPVWSANFTESASSAGGIDYDGEYLWVYPQNDNLYKLDIDWSPSSLDRTTWGAIKATF